MIPRRSKAVACKEHQAANIHHPPVSLIPEHLRNLCVLHLCHSLAGTRGFRAHGVIACPANFPLFFFRSHISLSCTSLLFARPMSRLLMEIELSLNGQAWVASKLLPKAKKVFSLHLQSAPRSFSRASLIGLVMFTLILPLAA